MAINAKKRLAVSLRKTDFASNALLPIRPRMGWHSHLPVNYFPFDASADASVPEFLSSEENNELKLWILLLELHLALCANCLAQPCSILPLCIQTSTE